MVAELKRSLPQPVLTYTIINATQRHRGNKGLALTHSLTIAEEIRARSLISYLFFAPPTPSFLSPTGVNTRLCLSFL